MANYHFGRACRHKRAIAGHSAHTDLLWRLGHILRRIQLWYQKNHQRRALRELDDYRLFDIGITREAAEHEAAKSFWV